MGDFSEHVLFGLLSAFVLFVFLENRLDLTLQEVLISSVAVLVGSVLPDIDNRNAYVHRSARAFASIASGLAALLFFPARFRYRFLVAASSLLLVWVLIGSVNVRHRGFIHSVSFCLIVAGLLTVAGVFFMGTFIPGPALGIGVLSHLVLDGELKLS